MASGNPDLNVRLQELDHELKDGDITRKGYEKRRTVLLSQYLGPEQAEQFQRTLRLHQADGDSPSVSLDSSFAASSHQPHDGRANNSSNSPSSQYGSLQPPSHVGRFQEQQRGGRAPSFPGQGAPLLLPGAADPAYDAARSDTMVSVDYRFNPETQPQYEDHPDPKRLSTMLDSQQGFFSDFAGQQMQEAPRDSYGGPQRYSSEVFSPSAGIAPPMLSQQDLPTAGMVECQMPLEPRDVPFSAFDPHDGNIAMQTFDNIGAVLRHRGRSNPRLLAYWVLDNKGKETGSITFEKLHARAEKVAQVIKDKSNLYRGDRVALVYRDSEIIDFAVALLGCFLAGVVAVPMNGADTDFGKLQLLLTTTQAHLALTTEENLRKFQRDISGRHLKWPTGVEWWKTNEFGSHHGKKRDDGPQLPAPDLAYIEFSRAPTGDLRGVVLSHRTIMHQMACLQAVLSTIPTDDTADTFNPALRNSSGGFVAPIKKSGAEVILSYLDPREGAGLILGVLLGVYGGHTTVWTNSTTVDTPGLYAHLITKYRATVMVADYPGLMRAVYNYQTDPMTTRNFKKNTEPNFSTVRICLVDTLTVDSDFHEILADRWLRPLRNTRARELVAPILCLPEHGGMIISMRDWLGGEERMGCPISEPEPVIEEKPVEIVEEDNGYSSLIGGNHGPKTEKPKSRTELSEVLLDKEALKSNLVRVLAMGEEVAKRANEPGTLRVGAFGYPIPDATLALVDPETNLLCPQYSIGELWVDSPSLSGGFWALPKHTETIFHARPYRFVEGNLNPVLVEPEFLRTGILGCVIEGKIFVLGLYEDRIRQRVEWSDSGLPDADHRYFFVQHLVISIMKNVLKIYDCSAFDSHVNGEYLPIVVLETQAASTAPTSAGGPPRQLDIPFLDSLSERVMDVLYAEHHLRVYCVMITAPNTLPRIIKNGRREIGNMLCRKEFDSGQLACVHVKFGIERAVLNLPIGDDPIGGIWSPLATQARAQILHMQDKQYSGVDYREVVMDERTSVPLNQFSNIHDLLQYRVSRQPEELSYGTIDARGKEGKGVNWKKFDQKVAAVAMYLKNKVRVQPGDHILLMYTHSEDFVFAVHACLCLGVVAIPMAPVDQNRLNEDAPALLHIIADFRIKVILVNHDVDSVFKQKLVSQHLKQSATILRVNIPNVYNTSKPPKQNHGCRELGLTVRTAWYKPGYPVLVWIFWTPDQRRIAVQLGHDTLMALCKVQKETCQMPSMRPVLGCVRSTIGLGFIHTCLMGIYLAAPTYLVSPVDFAASPNVLFQTLARYKIKDTYATSNMLDHAMAHGAGKTIGLHELKNLMISTEGRPRVDVYQKVRLHFAPAGLDRTAINTIYSHVLNPMVTSRSYMCIEPIELWLDRDALRRGLIAPVHPDTDPTALLLQDSGMVPVSTQISIVNPETNRLCLVGEYGEIWVQSEANMYAFYGSKDALDAERFNGRTFDGDPNVRYVRTGDLGFLHNVSRPIGPGGGQVDMQILFVLGNIGETFEVSGLCHFPMDIEFSVERCHRNIVAGGCAVFQAGGLVVVLVEVDRKNFLASIVPVIVNSVLNSHHFIVDIVAFVSKGDFPRSRLGEKQRGKILASWVTRKMRTIAQFAIRDDRDDEVAGAKLRSSVGPRGSASSATLYSLNGQQGPSGMKAQPQQQGLSHQRPLSNDFSGLNFNDSAPGSHHSLQQPQNEFHAELPAAYPTTSMLTELPEQTVEDLTDATPTASRRTSDNRTLRVHELSAGFDGTVDYSPIDPRGPFADEVAYAESPSGRKLQDSSSNNKSILQAMHNLPAGLLPPAAIVAEFDSAPSSRDGATGRGLLDGFVARPSNKARAPLDDGDDDDVDLKLPMEQPPPLPSYANKPYLSMLSEEDGREGRILPPTPPRTTLTDKTGRPDPLGPAGGESARSSRIANRDSTFVGNDDTEWPAEALLHMGIGVPPQGVPKRKQVPGSRPL